MFTILSSLSRLFTAYLPSNLGNDLGRSMRGLSEDVQSFIIRKDNHNPRVTNVFDDIGNHIYQVEESRGFSKKTWRIIDARAGELRASFTIGFLHRQVHLHAVGTVSMSLGRGITGKLHRYFYDEHGQLFSWNRRSNFLDSISSLGEKMGERRCRVAHIHQLRKGSYEWELLVDSSKINVVLALASALVFSRTEAVRNNVAIPGSRRSLRQCTSGRNTLSQTMKSAPKEAALSSTLHLADPAVCFTNNDIDRLRVFERKASNSEPREFFNPPAFLEDIAFRQKKRQGV